MIFSESDGSGDAFLRPWLAGVFCLADGEGFAAARGGVGVREWWNFCLSEWLTYLEYVCQAISQKK